MIDREELIKVKELWKIDHPGTMVGIGDNCIRVYVKEQKDTEQVPIVYAGIPVTCVVVGEITPLGE